MGLQVCPMPVLPCLMLGPVALHPRVALRWPPFRMPVHSRAVLGGIWFHLPRVPRLRLDGHRQSGNDPHGENHNQEALPHPHLLLPLKSSDGARLR
jgi:hypothetical protein